ncbi:MAG TPA: MBL fold metallo-hydrolase [Anaerolineaceae bacterium]|nr:MBL fold metallo-hydrolase [Anaerolineaceae bacterium]
MQIHPISCGLGYAFLIEGDAGLVLVDCGSPHQEKKVFTTMDALGRHDLKLIWITHAHYDHYGSASALHAKTGAPVGVHPADAETLRAGRSDLGVTRGIGHLFPLGLGIVNFFVPLPPVNPEVLLEDGASFTDYGIAAQVFHTPGHTPGHSSLWLEDGTLIIGDLIGQDSRVRKQTLLATDWQALEESFARMQALKPSRVYSGHSPRAIPGEEFCSL